MPVEIRKLVIQAKVAEPSISTSPSSENGKGIKGSEGNHEMIVDTCVKQVLKILNRQNSR